MSKEVIAVDVDDVLFPFAPEFVRHYNSVSGGQLSLDDIADYDFQRALGLSREETSNVIYGFINPGHIDIEPLETARESIARLADEYELAVVTARHPDAAVPTGEWLERFFPGMFGAKHYVGYAEVMPNPVTKNEICRQLGASALIDDNIGHLKICSDDGRSGVLFGDYGWNRGVELPPNVARCSNWAAVLNHLGM